MSQSPTKMQCVFEDIDMTTLVLRGLFGTYVEEAKQPHNNRRGPSRPSPELRTATLRTILRQTLRSVVVSSRVCRLWKTASMSAFQALLEIVEAQFQLVHAGVLDFLRREPVVYDCLSVAANVPREEAIRSYGDDWNGRIILEPLRVCFEVPVSMGRSGRFLPLGNIRNPIAPHREDFAHWSPVHLALHVHRAGHWLRVWTAELTWVDPPTHNPEALWLAMNRGCPVCGKQCTLQGHRADLVAAEHHNTEEYDMAMGMHNRSPGPDQNPWVGMNAHLEIPWDLPDVHTRLVGAVPHDPVTRLATRILPYAHRAHMVTLKFKNTARQQGEHRTASYKCYFDCPPGVDPRMYDQTEDEIMLGCVIGALYEAVPHPSSPTIKDHGAFIKGIFTRRRDAIQNSGLYKYMVDSGMEKLAIDMIYHAKKFVATLPLFPMRGHPEAHSWCNVLNLTEEQFQTLAWRGGFGGGVPPSYVWNNNGEWRAPLGGVDDELKKWRQQTLRHMIAFLSNRLPQFDHAAFYHVSEVGVLQANAGVMPLQYLSDPYPSHILNAFEHARFLTPPGIVNVTAAIYANQLLLETWQDFQDLVTDDVDKHLHILNRQSRLDATYDQMLKHFLRLDSVIGPAWRHVTRDGLDDEDAVCAQSMVLKVALCHLKKSPNLAPAPLLTRHSRILPGAPCHPDVWLRWFLRALVKPEMHETDLNTETDWEYVLEVELRNTFIIDASRQDRDHVDSDNVGAHLTFYALTSTLNSVRTTPRHMRMSIGMRLSALDAIKDGINDTKAELDENKSLGSREVARGVKTLISKDLASWHHDAYSTCCKLTNHVRSSKPLALDLLRRFLNAEWTPVTQKQGMDCNPKWVEGWHALHSHCLPGCEWFASTASLLPFCKVRGLSTCACSARCIF